MVKSKDLKHIQMKEVPKAYHTTIKEKKGNTILFYQDLLQISVRTNAILIVLDKETPKEISQIEQMD